MLAFGVLLLVLADSPQSPFLRADPGQEAVTASFGDGSTTLWGRYPVTLRNEDSFERMNRRIMPLRLVRVRALPGTFIGHVGAVRPAGLVSLAPDPTRAWSGPIDVLSWRDIRTIEVRRRSPLRTSGAGGAAGAILGVIGGIAYTKVNGGDDLMGGFLFGLGGCVVGGTIGFGVGCVVPIWEPLYRSP